MSPDVVANVFEVVRRRVALVDLDDVLRSALAEALRGPLPATFATTLANRLFNGGGRELRPAQRKRKARPVVAPDPIRAAPTPAPALIPAAVEPPVAPEPVSVAADVPDVTLHVPRARGAPRLVAPAPAIAPRRQTGRLLGPMLRVAPPPPVERGMLDADDPHLARLLRGEEEETDASEETDAPDELDVDEEDKRPALRSIMAPIVDAPRMVSAAGTDESDELRRRVYAEISARQPVRWVDVCGSLGLGNRARGPILTALLKRRLVFARGLGPDSILATREDLLPAEEVSGLHRLPMLAVGEGPRRDDCANYDDCLGRFVRLKVRRRDLSNRGAGIPRPDSGAEVPGHCPNDCASYEAVPNHVRLGLATAGGASPISTAQ